MSKLLPIFRLDNFDFVDFGGRVEVAFALVPASFLLAGHYQDVHQWNYGCDSQSLQDVLVGSGWYDSST